MKTLSGAALAALQTQYGSEPIIVVGVKWTPSGNEILYADRAFPGVEGRILDISNIEDILNILNGKTSINVSLKLDDTDNFISNLMKTYDIHQSKVTVYQWFADIALEHKFPIFVGNVETPITWVEGERTVSFDVVSQVEDVEVGFSPESGQFAFVSPDSVGNAWPLVFGTAINVPATKVSEAPTGSLREAFGIVDGSLYQKEALLTNREQQLLGMLSAISVINAYGQEIAAPAIELRAKYIGTLREVDALFKELLKEQNELIKINKKLQNSTLNAAAKLNLTRDKNDTNKNITTLIKKLQDYNGYKNVATFWLSILDYEDQVVKEGIQKMNDILQQIFQTQQALIEVRAVIAEQEAFVKDEIYIVNGTKFPQGEPVNLLINGLVFGGTFDGDKFTITSQGSAPVTNIQVTAKSGTIDTVTIDKPDVRVDGMYALTSTGYIVKLSGQNGADVQFELQGIQQTNTPPDTTNLESTYQPKQLSGETRLAISGLTAIDNQDINNLIEFDYYVNSEAGRMIPTPVLPGQKYQFDNSNIGYIVEASPTILQSWLSKVDVNTALNSSTAWFADVGSDVRLDGDPTIYAVNIVGGQLLSVTAKRAIDGVMKMATVPEQYYTTLNVTKGAYNILLLKMPRALGTYTGQGWDDQLYVTVRSTVGPSVTDVVRWCIETYTNDQIDDASFATVASALSNFPINCVVKDRKNLVSILQEIAWQSRCRIIRKQGKWYMYYLSATPTPVATITEDDIISNSLVIKLSQTDNLATKLVCTWYQDLAADKPNKTVLRHNINKYGTKESSYDFWIYNDQEEVERSATFWLIRYANVWKYLEFKTSMDHLDLESGDAITISLSNPHIANTDVIGIIDSVVYDSASYTCTYTVWTPVKAGTNVVYDLAWPSSVEVSTEFPTFDEVAAGNAGSGQPSNTSISSPISDQLPSLEFNSRPKDHGTQFPSDAAYSGPNPTMPSAPGLPGQVPRNANPNIPNGLNVNPNNPFVPLRRDSLQNVWGAVLLKYQNDEGKVQVQLNTGEIGDVQLVPPPDGDWDRLPGFTPIIVSKNVQGTFFGVPFVTKTTHYKGIIESINTEAMTVVCDFGIGEEKTIKVRLPKNFNQFFLEHEDEDLRAYPFGKQFKYGLKGTPGVSQFLNCTQFDDQDNPSLVFYAVLTPQYHVGSTIYFHYDYDDNYEGSGAYFVDSNRDGRHWAFSENWAPNAEDFTIQNDDDAIKLNFGNQAKIPANNLGFFPRGTSFKAGEVTLHFKARYLDNGIQLVITGIKSQPAKTIRFQLLDALKPNGKAGSAPVEVVAWFDGDKPQGSQPGEKVKVYTELGHQGDKDGLGLAFRRTNGTYEVIIVECTKESGG